MEDPEVESKIQAMMAAAEPADWDTEHKLVALQDMQDRRRKDPVLEAEYERLRDELADQIAIEGPRYYIDKDNIKRYAYVIQPEPIEVDVKALIKAAEDGEISQATLEEVAPRKVDKAAFTRAAARGSNPRSRKPGIPPAVFVRVARKVKGTAYIGFSEPVDPADR